MKKVSFHSPAPPTNATQVDAWVENREVGEQEPMKRLTIDVPLSLHKRIKTQCAVNNQVMADEIRTLLEQRFPASQNTEHSQASLQGVPS